VGVIITYNGVKNHAVRVPRAIMVWAPPSINSTGSISLRGMARTPAGGALIRVWVPSENVTREVVIKARLDGNTLVIETPNYRAELEIGFARVETPRYKAWLDTEDVMEVDNIIIDYMNTEDWEELITTITEGGDVESVLEKLIATRGTVEEDWWEE